MSTCHFDVSRREVYLNNCKTVKELTKVFEDLSSVAFKSSSRNLQSVTHLYLNNNKIRVLPLLDLIEIFPRIEWLDLRNNRIKTLEGSGPQNLRDSEKCFDKCVTIQVLFFIFLHFICHDDS